MTSFLLSLGSTSRLCALAPHISRSLATRARPIPEPRGTHLLPPASQAGLTPTADSITTPADFLKAIGRSADTKVSIESWEEFWKQSGPDLKAAGVGIRDRRYILWCMEKYRNGIAVPDFAHEPKLKKTIRGWGPSVQNGKRIRSRRDKTKRTKSLS
ncbi:hypothetical protein B0H10DRAFT_1789155 [Mycena sp. CBHHK59/15]|nr:hypothetical protein B0H10DRAFT_1789155 [Mycena sp. CBHHK59/15]